uniref:transposase n=1 Tax=Sedimenticola hydrogenitrophicus TaxID=2967975 RepID=UPI003AAF39C2
RYFNYSYRRSGTLWEGRFKSCVVNAEDYLLLCQRYIELNPVRAGMVMSPGDYHWSSYQANGLGRSVACWTPHPVYLSLGHTHAERSEAYRALFRYELDWGVVKDIRRSADQGMALGNERFQEEIERLSGRRVIHLKRGPKGKADTR